MGRGLGKIQQEILTLLRTKRSNKDGWYGVGSIAEMIVNGHDIYESFEASIRKLTEAENQSIWRAIRTLENRGLIESRFSPVYEVYRYNQLGGATRNKDIRLVHPKFPMD